MVYSTIEAGIFAYNPMIVEEKDFILLLKRISSGINHHTEMVSSQIPPKSDVFIFLPRDALFNQRVPYLERCGGLLQCRDSWHFRMRMKSLERNHSEVTATLYKFTMLSGMTWQRAPSHINELTNMRPSRRS